MAVKMNNRRNNERRKEEKEDKLKSWVPRTEIGKQVKKKKIKNIDELFARGKKILEPEIIDLLLPDLETDLIRIGQSKGKFGGGKRRIWRQTQKKTMEGNKPKFSTMTVVGNRDGFIGIGRGKAKETMPAREKSLRQAKLNLINIMIYVEKLLDFFWLSGTTAPKSYPFHFSYCILV